jgi:hypothetical protein
MNAYLFSAWVNRWYHGQYLDSCSSVILYGGDVEVARKAFEKGLQAEGGSESDAPVKIIRTLAAPVHDQLITENGSLPIDWRQLSEEMTTLVETSELDNTDQGYWVDCNACLQLSRLSANIESLQLDLTDDIRSGLNWSLDKTYFFLVSVLSPVAPQPQYDLEELERHGQHDSDEDENSELAEEVELCPFPEVVDKELAVLVRARNSVVAAWLWRRQAAGTPLSQRAIRVVAPPPAVPVAGESS